MSYPLASFSEEPKHAALSKSKSTQLGRRCSCDVLVQFRFMLDHRVLVAA